MMSEVTFDDWARILVALVVLLGGGALLWYGKVTAETALAVDGVVVGFYFGSSAGASVTRAVTRALGERGYKE